MASLAGDFAPTNEGQWRKLALAALKGGAFERLVSRSDDSIEIQPIYPRREGPRVAAAGGPWRIMARVDHPQAGAANAQALDDLTNGADGLEIIFAGAAGAYGYGLDEASPVSLAALFEGIRFDVGARLSLDLGPAAEAQALAVAAAVEAAGADPAALDLELGLDPLGALARSGQAREDWPEMAQSLGRLAVTLRQRGFAGPLVAADARCVHAAGGSQGQELAFALSAALDYWRALEGAGMAPESA